MIAVRPIRVLHITESPAAGVGRHVLDLAEGLIARGHENAIVFSAHRMDPVFAQRASSIRHLQLHRVDMRRGPHPVDALVIRRIRNYFKTAGPFDIVHGHSSKGGAVARLACSKGLSKVVYTPHCIYTLNPQANRLALYATRAIERRLAHRTDAIIAVSPEERDHILALGIHPDKVHCVINGLKGSHWMDRQAARRALRLPEDAVVVGFLGRLSQQKDPLLLVRAFARLTDLKNVHLAIAGSGELQGQAEQIARSAGMIDRVSWLGYRSPEETLPAFDVFTLPSVYEGMPYVLLESLAAGLPIVATDVGGARSTVQPAVNGFIVPRSSPERMADAIRDLVTSPQMRARFRTASQNLVSQFTVDRMVDETARVYEQVLSQ